MPIGDYDELTCACALSRIFAYNCLASKQLADSVEYLSEIFEMPWKTLAAAFPNHTEYADKIKDRSFLEGAARELDFVRESGAEAIYINDRNYPRRLKNCPDAPLVLYYRGNCDLNALRVLAIVGTRSATVYGKNVCREILHGLSGNPIKPLIVSGLAYGIDIAAHRAALEFGLETVGCMATGLDKIYPEMHESVALKMIGQGALLTDFGSGTEPFKENFVRRNRIIAGMSDAVLVVESKQGGGSMITARLANEYGRELFAVPGRTTDVCSQGTNYLIENERARLSTGTASIEAAMGWADPLKDSKEPRQRELFAKDDTPEKKKVLEALRKESPLCTDDIRTATGLSLQQISSVMIQLEMESRVALTAANLYELR
jgi:DNA processing protein